MYGDFSACHQFLTEWSMSINLKRILKVRRLLNEKQTYANINPTNGQKGFTSPPVHTHTLLNLHTTWLMAFSTDVSVITSAMKTPPHKWVLITDDLRLTGWVCLCTINLKEQRTVKGYIRTKQLCSGQGVSIQGNTRLETRSKPKTKRRQRRCEGPENDDNIPCYK